MKKIVFCTVALITMLLSLTGCQGVGSKANGVTAIYGVTAALAIVILVGYCFLIRKKNPWFVALFSSVAVVNSGYFWLSLSTTLNEALWANRLSYLGSVFLPFSMLMIIVNVTKTKHSKRLPLYCTFVNVIVFLIAASPDYLDIYYKHVTLGIENGATVLIKTYGAWHGIYLVFLFGYFAVIIATIIYALIRKTFDATSHAVILVIAVFVNIGVWFIEQFVDIKFEMLSISYIISELFLLCLRYIINENQSLKALVNGAKEVGVIIDNTDGIVQTGNNLSGADIDAYKMYLSGLAQLTQTEKKIFEAYVARATTKEIMASFNIKENTLKFHNKNIYGKLGVTSRQQLLEMYKQIKNINR